MNYPTQVIRIKLTFWSLIQVVAGSKELIDINLGVGEACYLLKQASREENALQTTGEKPG